MKTINFLLLIIFAFIIPIAKITAQTNNEEAILTYQLAQEEFDKANYTKAAQYLDKVEKLNPEAKIKASYLKAKCFFNTLPESFETKDRKNKEEWGLLSQRKYFNEYPSNKGCAFVNYVTYSAMFANFNIKENIQNIKAWSICGRKVLDSTFNLDFTAYSMCMANINYYRINGKDEEKKSELLKLKIQIENTDEYNLVETTELCNLGWAEEQKGDFLEAKKYYEKSRDYCKFKPLYFNPLLEVKKNGCCFFPNFVMDLAIESMNKKIKESGK